MKVLQINAVLGTASTGRIVSELAAGLEERGIECHVAHSVGNATTRSFRIGSDFEKTLHAIGSRVIGKQAYFSRLGTRRLLEYIAAEAPDVVHLHNLHGNYINLPMLLEYLADNDIATVVTLHDCWFFTGKCCHYTSSACSRWETGCGECPRLHEDNPSWFRDASADVWEDKKRLFEAIPRLAIIGVSDWITSQAQRSLLSHASIIRRIYNWVDLDVFTPVDASDLRRTLGVEGHFVILGVASRWSLAKGLSDFVRLAELIDTGEMQDDDTGSGGGGGSGVTIVLVGKADTGFTPPAAMQLAGATDDVHELAAYYSAADVFLQLSREETFGKVTAEALSCGTPAIVYDSTANSELIGANCGYVVESGNVDQLADRVRQIVGDSKAPYSQSCRRHAERHFEKDARIDDHVRVYLEVHDLQRRR